MGEVLGDPIKLDQHGAENHTMNLSRGKKLLAAILIVLSFATIAYSQYQISSAQGNIAIDQHKDQFATGLLTISVQKGLVGAQLGQLSYFRSSNYYYKGALKLFKVDELAIVDNERQQTEYSWPLIISTAFLGALLGWAITEFLRARRGNVRAGAVAASGRETSR